MIDDCDERAVALSSTRRVARKRHRCSECRRVIAIGERYLVEAVASDGCVRTHRTCTHCCVVRKWLCNTCGGWAYTYIEEDLRQHIERQGAVREYGISVARMAVGMARQWRAPSGRLDAA